jgi:DNA-binding transcriptional ArsR family regulator
LTYSIISYIISIYAIYRVYRAVTTMKNIKVASNSTEPFIRISGETVHNILCSICIVDQEVENLSPWVDHTRSIISAEDRKLCGQCCEAASFVPRDWASGFDAWLDYFRSLDPEYIRKTMLDKLVSSARSNLPGHVIPDSMMLSQDRRAFGELVQKLYESMHESATEDVIDRDFANIQDPLSWRDRITHFITRMWEESLKDEWSRAQSMVNDSAKAFKEIPLQGTTLEEKLCFLTGRDEVPEMWMKIFNKMEEIIWIPSPHIGPYMILFHQTETQAWFISRARLPKGSSVHSVLLDKADLLIRLSALADPIRLEIVHMASTQGVITTQTIMDELGLTQSSTSRHLAQLAATGILHVDSGEKTKRYSLNLPRYEETVQSLRGIAEIRGAPGGS